MRMMRARGLTVPIRRQPAANSSSGPDDMDQRRFSCDLPASGNFLFMSGAKPATCGVCCAAHRAYPQTYPRSLSINGDLTADDRSSCNVANPLEHAVEFIERVEAHPHLALAAAVRLHRHRAGQVIGQLALEPLPVAGFARLEDDAPVPGRRQPAL